MRRDAGLFRQYLKKARRSARLTIPKFSGRTGISTARCREFERGTADPDEAEMERIAAALGVGLGTVTECEKRYLRWRRTARRAMQFAALSD